MFALYDFQRTRAGSPGRFLGAVFLVGLSLVSLATEGARDPVGAPFRRVSQSELVAAMALEEGYDLLATTNVARFQASVILRLAKEAAGQDSNQVPLLISHMEWFNAFSERTGLPFSEMPLASRLAYEHRQDQIIDYRYERVIAKIAGDDPPEMALSIRVAWPKERGLADTYSMVDTLAVPRLRVTNHRVITYRLLDFGDVVVYDEIRGLTGRPTTGALGLLFKLIGDGHVVRSAMALAPDGLLVSRVRSKKGIFKVNTTVTVTPNGHMNKGLPKGRSDLRKLENKLKRPAKIQYQPFGPAFTNFFGAD